MKFKKKIKITILGLLLLSPFSQVWGATRDFNRVTASTLGSFGVFNNVTRVNFGYLSGVSNSNIVDAISGNGCSYLGSRLLSCPTATTTPPAVTPPPLAGVGTSSNAGNFTNTVPPPVTVRPPVNTTVVPVPAAVWLFGSALMGLIATGKRRKVS